jgi:hypothetical protein
VVLLFFALKTGVANNVSDYANNVSDPANIVRQRKRKEKEKEKESELDYCTGAVSPCAKLGQDLTDWERKHLQDRLGPVKLLHYLEIAEDRAVLGQPSRNLYQDICRWEREGTYPME